MRFVGFGKFIFISLGAYCMYEDQLGLFWRMSPACCCKTLVAAIISEVENKSVERHVTNEEAVA